MYVVEKAINLSLVESRYKLFKAGDIKPGAENTYVTVTIPSAPSSILYNLSESLTIPPATALSCQYVVAYRLFVFIGTKPA